MTLEWLSLLRFRRVTQDPQGPPLPLAELERRFEASLATNSSRISKSDEFVGGEFVTDSWTRKQSYALTFYSHDEEVGAKLAYDKYLAVATMYAAKFRCCLPIVTVGELYGAHSIVLDIPDETVTSLSFLLATQPRMDFDNRLQLIRSIAAALEEIHLAGITMRIVTPDYFVVHKGRCLIRDLGAARPSEWTDAVPMLSNPEIGFYVCREENYFSPERSRALDIGKQSSDVFSFGLIAYEILVGKLPFPDRTAKHVSDADMQHFVPIRETVPECPSDMSSLLEQCLAVSSDDRPKSLKPIADWGTPPIDPPSGLFQQLFRARRNKLR